MNNNGEKHNPQNHMNHSNHMHHDNHASHIIIVAMHIIMEILKLSFVSLILAIPIILLSPMMGVNLPFQFTFPGSEWVVLILSTILFFYGGKPFLSGGKDEIATKNQA